MATLRALVHASELLTGAGIRVKAGRRVVDSDIGRIEDGAIVYSVKKVGAKEVPHRVEWVGETKALPRRYAKAKKTNLKGERAVVPAFVDCHTHLIFAGDRSN